MKLSLLFTVLASSFLVALGIAFTRFSSQPGIPVPPEILTDQPQKTSNWFASLYSFPSHPVYALPGAYQISSEGLTVSYPEVKVGATTISSGFASDCNLGFLSPVTGVQVVHYGDWNVIVDLLGSNTRAFLTQGSPLVYLDNQDMTLTVTCPGATVTTGDSYVLFSSGSKHVLLQAQDPEAITQHADTYTLSATSPHFRLALLPDPSVLDLFISQVWNPVYDTLATYSQTGSTVSTTYQLITLTGDTTLTTLFPHQVPFLSDNLDSLGSYTTALGDFNLVSTRSFTTTVPLPTLSTTFTPVTDPDQVGRITQAVNQDLDRYATPISGGVYFQGTDFGALATLVQLADVYHLQSQKQQALDLLQDQLIAVLNSNFIYDSGRGLLVATNSEFGNNEGNDHHFHYGYYIRAAAVLLSQRPDLRQQLEPTVHLMIADIANPDPGSDQFPRLRHFSPYEGHSWADGDANFVDGNNQESTSEALNAWYALSLWGQATSDQGLQGLGNWLFSQELIGTQTYWFGDHNPFPAGYPHSIASIIWSGKRDFATWFSGETMHIYGIQFLPVTPASIYLSSLPNPSAHLDEINADHPNPTAHEWADLYLAYLSFSDPETALALLPQVNTTSGLKLESLLLHTIFSNQ